jgi:O-antigen/teichoic acid export membrane protein
MIGYFLESEFVGYYRSIQPLREATTFIIGSFSFIYMPLATEYFEDDNIASLDAIYTASTKWVMMCTFPIVLVIGLFSDDIVRTLLGSDYLPAAPVLAILIFGLFFRAFVGLNGDTVKAIDRTKIELFSAVFGLLANISLNLVLIPIYGIRGAAVATVAGYIIYNSIEVLSLYRITGIHPFSVNNIKPLMPPLVVGTILAQILSTEKISLLPLIIIGLVLGIVQFVSPFITGSITQEDRHLIDEAERRIGISIPWKHKI